MDNTAECGSRTGSEVCQFAETIVGPKGDLVVGNCLDVDESLNVF